MEGETQEKLKNEVRNRPRNHENSGPRGCPGALSRPPGSSWGVFWVLLDDFVEVFGEVGAKMGPRWAQDGPSWQQDTPKMGHDGAKMALLGSVWELLGRSWQHFSRLFLRDLGEKLPKCKNDQHYSTFATILGVGASSGGSWRLPWEGFGRYVGRLWLQGGVFLAISGDVWTSWRQGWRTRAQDAVAERKSWIFGGLEGSGVTRVWQ